MSIRTVIVLLVGIALGAGGASAAFRYEQSKGTPSLYTNSDGADVLRHPSGHIAAAVQYRGTVLGDRRLPGGVLLAMRIDGAVVAAHIYDATWAPAHIGQPLEIQGRVRGTLGDPIEASGIPVSAPLTPGAALIDVAAATGPHRAQSAARRPSRERATPLVRH